MSANPNKAYPVGRICEESGCEKILSIYTKGPKCRFHSASKERQAILKAMGKHPSHHGSLCTSGPWGNAAHVTFMRYEGNY